MLLYDYVDSENCYKIRLLCAQTACDYRKVSVDIALPETLCDVVEFTATRRFPIVILDDGKSLFESNAILTYFAENSSFYSTDPIDRSRILRWSFFEQNSHEPNIATIRFWVRLGRSREVESGVVQAKRKLGSFALEVMEKHHQENTFFACGRYTIADIALYAYTHVPVEGGFTLTDYPAVSDWLNRARQQPDHVPLHESQHYG